MKQYVIDQLRYGDFEKIQEFLDTHTHRAAMEGIYWVNLPERLWSAVQREHGACRPHYFAINLGHDEVAFELLVRSSQVIRCNCIAYATPEQREFILDFADDMLGRLNIKV